MAGQIRAAGGPAVRIIFTTWTPLVPIPMGNPLGKFTQQVGYYDHPELCSPERRRSAPPIGRTAAAAATPTYLSAPP